MSTDKPEKRGMDRVTAALVRIGVRGTERQVTGSHVERRTVSRMFSKGTMTVLKLHLELSCGHKVCCDKSGADMPTSWFCNEGECLKKGQP